MYFMSSTKKVCNEEAHCHAVNEADLMWEERGGAGPMSEQLKPQLRRLSRRENC